MTRNGKKIIEIWKLIIRYDSGRVFGVVLIVFHGYRAAYEQRAGSLSRRHEEKEDVVSGNSLSASTERTSQQRARLDARQTSFFFPPLFNFPLKRCTCYTAAKTGSILLSMSLTPS